MSAETQEEIQKHVKIYMMVFGALMGLTMVTVAVSYLDLSVFASIILALSIASVKGSLVACFFMHLISEKVLIYYALGLTAIFFLVLMIVPLLTGLDRLGI